MTVGIVLATHNSDKVVEFRTILNTQLPELEIVTYDGPDPVESGVTFSENALIKARAAAEHTGLPALADDSGICVDILGGSPGIFSARWAGTDKDATTNRNLLLSQLTDIDNSHRAAYYVCHIALVVPERVRPGGFEEVAVGEWKGRVISEARGTHGFGYDPIFVPEGFDVTAAELLPEEKNVISHRARAFERLIPLLRMNIILQ